jgi:hypothetical protein
MGPAQVGVMATVIIGLAIGISASARAGGELDNDHDEGDSTSGPYGFVKDTRGADVPEATVMVDIKNRGTITTQSNVLGAYRIPTYGQEVKPDDVTVTCKKQGYKMVRAVPRMEQSDPKAGFEIECVLERQ